MAKYQYSADSARLPYPTMLSARPLPAPSCDRLRPVLRVAPRCLTGACLKQPRAA